MRITYGPAFSVVSAGMSELLSLQRLLTYQIKDGVDFCLVQEDNLVPTGIVPHAKRCMERSGIAVELVDFPPLEWPPVIWADLLDCEIVLRDWQLMVVAKTVVARRGIVAAPTGGGKTVMYGALLAHLDLPSVTVCAQINHAEQFVAKLQSYGLDAGLVVDGEAPDAKHVVGVANSISRWARREPVHRVLAEAQILGFDEAHHLGTANTWQDIASVCDAHFRVGLSATPFESPDDPYSNLADVSLIGLLGPIIADPPVQMLHQRRELAPAQVFMQPVTSPQVDAVDHLGNVVWHDLRKQGIVEHERRNGMLLKLISEIRKERPDSSILVLVSLIAHGDFFVAELHDRGISSVFLSGNGRVSLIRGGEVTEGSDDGSYVERFISGDVEVLVGSVIFDEAVDLPHITDVVMAGGGKKVRRTRQRVGRALRGTEPVRIWDMLDEHNPVLRHHAHKRKATYEADGWGVKIGFPLRMPRYAPRT